MERVDFTVFFGKTHVASKSTISTLYIKRIFRYNKIDYCYFERKTVYRIP